MTTRGRRGLTHILEESISEKTVRLAPWPVLVLHLNSRTYQQAHATASKVRQKGDSVLIHHLANAAIPGLYLVAPDDREEDIRSQVRRPAFKSISSLSVHYLPYSELESHREAMARFGEGTKALEAIARTLAI